ncbi:hypothetical protein T439DRAFT_325154 [Meredithblackwellia eburnea MCA 4105]
MELDEILERLHLQILIQGWMAILAQGINRKFTLSNGHNRNNGTVPKLQYIKTIVELIGPNASLFKNCRVPRNSNIRDFSYSRLEYVVGGADAGGPGECFRCGLLQWEDFQSAVRKPLLEPKNCTDSQSHEALKSFDLSTELEKMKATGLSIKKVYNYLKQRQQERGLPQVITDKEKHKIKIGFLWMKLPRYKHTGETRKSYWKFMGRAWSLLGEYMHRLAHSENGYSEWVNSTPVPCPLPSLGLRATKRLQNANPRVLAQFYTKYGFNETM